ncbi:MAG: hypothetical protein CVV24_05525 [Ignavibacteriae bacterium HGW-Ignavibacteriae-3]|nr:MAG: hypothetical protein CVV24_05525 [Ignavibacteriae bacterium HGW-Ignavibacteriae-3]
MITNRDIIIFNDDWGRFPSTLQHIARVLMNNNNRIFWVGSLGLRKPKISLSDFNRAAQKFIRVLFKKREKDNSEEIVPVLIYPFVIPFHDLKIIRKLNDFLIAREVNKILAENNALRPLFITSAPISDGLVGKLGESCSIFYCVDDYSFMDRAFKCIPSREKLLVEKVDAVFAVSDSLIQSRKSPSGNTFFAPQGVQTAHFKKKPHIPDSLSEKKSPVIGFFGLISEWINLELIYDCVINYPGYNFILIGKSVRDLNRFNDCKNFTYLGAVDYKELPDYASVFDVGLIPFELNEITIPANPLKLLEYFSLGIPVVSTNLPEAKKFSELAFIARNNSEFVDMIRMAVEDNKSERNLLRTQKAEEYSWEAVTEKVFDTVLKIESDKNNKKQVVGE